MSCVNNTTTNYQKTNKKMPHATVLYTTTHYLYITDNIHTMIREWGITGSNIDVYPLKYLSGNSRRQQRKKDYVLILIFNYNVNSNFIFLLITIMCSHTKYNCNIQWNSFGKIAKDDDHVQLKHVVIEK
jgi:hypothetical protein